MNRVYKMIFIVVVAIAVFVGGILLTINNLRNDVNKSIIVKTDKEAIISRFPNIGEIKNCYWKADLISKNGNDRVPGPSLYWMKGFVELDKDKISDFIEKYNMKELSLAPNLEFLPENFDLSTSRWFYSDMFNKYIIPPNFYGNFYVDNVNQVVYFEVTK